MSFDQLHSLSNSLLQAMQDDQKLSVDLLGYKLNKLSSQFPEDKTIGAVARVISDMQYNKKAFIRQADFKKLANQSFTFNTKFAELFQEELNLPTTPAETNKSEHQAAEVKSYQPQDQILASALETAFDKHIPLKLFSAVVANRALKSVSNSLESWSLSASQLSVSTGNDKVIVVQADYETPKGLTSVLVPVEVEGNQVVMQPEVFIGNQGPQELNHTELKSYITSQAGKKSQLTGSAVLAAFTNATTEKREISAAELALTRLHASRQGQGDFLNGQVIGLKVNAEAVQDVKTPTLQAAYLFEQEMAAPKGQANQRFGEKLVIAARQHISRQLASFGFPQAQIVVAGSDDKSIKYAVALNAGQTAFMVPVKIADHQIQQPTVLLCNGSVSTFDQDGINQLVSNDQTDNKVASVASDLGTLKPSELLKNLRQAIAEDNHAKAEDALNVLANCGDAKAHAIGFQLYLDGLGQVKTAATKCANQLKSKVSQYPVCAHTGLPVNKVYQDKNGFCRPMFRQGMEETYEGASFMNAKIFG